MKTNMADIGTLFKVEFEKQEKNIANLISANLKTRMDEIKKTQDEMKKVSNRSNISSNITIHFYKIFTSNNNC